MIAEIAEFTAVDAFGVLEPMAEIVDPHGRSFFRVDPGTSGDDIRRAVLMTYVLNAGTGYGRVRRRDFPATPYCAAEVRRIIDRQRANRWSYAAAKALCNGGGSLVTTPNGMLMGVGGSRIHDRFSQRAGTTWGDVFLVNVFGVNAFGVNAAPTADPVAHLRRIVRSGRLWHRGAFPDDPFPTGLELDRVLHHEEVHAQQWARLGRVRMGASYLAAEARARIAGDVNRFEVEAGLRDGGYLR